MPPFPSMGTIAVANYRSLSVALVGDAQDDAAKAEGKRSSGLALLAGSSLNLVKSSVLERPTNSLLTFVLSSSDLQFKIALDIRAFLALLR